MTRRAARTWAVRLQHAWYAGSAWLHLLVPLEWLYRLVIGVRRAAYRVDWLRVYRSRLPVVVVGNLTVGGTGKTPTVIALVEALAARGVRAGVVSRGYLARGKRFPLRVDAACTHHTCGDEAAMVFRRTGAPCVVAPRRREAIALLESDNTVDIVISDDGLQHYAMARDFEILLYDERAGFGNGRCLPAGPLREPLQRLGEADVVLARSGAATPGSVAIMPEAFINAGTGERRPVDSHGLPDSVIAVAGVGLPELFFATLEGLGFKLETREFPDHHEFQADDIATSDDRPVIMTEKDAVKCAALATPDTWYLRVSAIVPESVVDRVAALAVTRDALLT